MLYHHILKTIKEQYKNNAICKETYVTQSAR